MGLLDFAKWTHQPTLSDKARVCSKILGLTPGQRRVCRRHKDHMPAVSAGVRQGIEECQHQFRSRRWNCSVVEDGSVFGPLALIASRETAFTHAVTAAGVSLSISRACKDGSLASCGCSRAGRPRNLHRDWMWGGCGDNLEYGYTYNSPVSFHTCVLGEQRLPEGFLTPVTSPHPVTSTPHQGKCALPIL
ncbi:hypothetical protein ACJJTC_004253 [Scirpophaga incertulas]